MASITKTKGRWQARVRLKGHKLRCKTFDARREAVAWAQETETALRKRSPAAEEMRRLATTLTLRGVLQRYENEVTPGKKSAERERYMMRNLRAQPELVDKPIGDILASDISAWLSRRRQSVAEGTALREWCLLQHVFEVARRDWGVAVDNPLKEARRPKPASARERRLEPGEESSLLEACGKARVPWLTPLVCLAIDTAMRQGEHLSLTWADVSADGKYVALAGQLTKTSKARTVPLSPRNRHMLAALRPKGAFSSGRIFPLTRNAVRLAWTRARERGGMPDLRFHDLRHEATSRFFEMGLDTMEVAAITGHETLQMLKRYAHLRTKTIAQKLTWPADACAVADHDGSVVSRPTKSRAKRKKRA